MAATTKAKVDAERLRRRQLFGTIIIRDLVEHTQLKQVRWIMKAHMVKTDRATYPAKIRRQATQQERRLPSQRMSLQDAGCNRMRVSSDRCPLPDARHADDCSDQTSSERPLLSAKRPRSDNGTPNSALPLLFVIRTRL